MRRFLRIRYRRGGGKQNTKHSNLLKNLGLPQSESLLRSIIEKRDCLESHARLFRHTIPMLRRLRKQGYMIGIISNTSIFAIDHIKKTKLLDYVDYPLFSYMVGAIKPDPRIFNEMLRRAKVRPEEALMIGDKLDDDIRPARKLGINSIHFNGFKDLKARLAGYNIEI
ncbi:MAG: HAD-IA family hydrolase [Candidatus Micrarchaeia archaeon]